MYYTGYNHYHFIVLCGKLQSQNKVGMRKDNYVILTARSPSLSYIYDVDISLSSENETVQNFRTCRWPTCKLRDTLISLEYKLDNVIIKPNYLLSIRLIPWCMY